MAVHAEPLARLARLDAASPPAATATGGGVSGAAGVTLPRVTSGAIAGEARAADPRPARAPRGYSQVAPNPVLFVQTQSVQFVMAQLSTFEHVSSQPPPGQSRLTAPALVADTVQSPSAQLKRQPSVFVQVYAQPAPSQLSLQPSAFVQVHATPGTHTVTSSPQPSGVSVERAMSARDERTRRAMVTSVSGGMKRASPTRPREGSLASNATHDNAGLLRPFPNL